MNVADLIDVDGRPLGETAAAAYASTDTELGRCPFHDRRRGSPMNLSALRQLVDLWPDLLRTAGALAGPSATGHDAWRAVTALTHAAALHFEAHPDEPVPRLLSAAYKSAIGFSTVLTFSLLARKGAADAPVAALGTGEELFDWLDREGWLLGEEQVCAGSQRQIAEFWQALGGHAHPAPSAWQVLRDNTDAVQREMSRRAVQVAGILHGEPLPTESSPWLHAVHRIPLATPQSAKRLFPIGKVPRALQEALDKLK